MTDVEEFPGLAADLGDYTLVLDAVRIGHEVGVTRIELTAKPGGEDELVGITALTLHSLAREIQKLAEHLVSRRMATTEIGIRPGTLATFTYQGQSGSATVTEAQVTDLAQAAELAEDFASRRRERLTDADLADVAEVVKQAESERRPIQAAVAEARFVTPSRAGHLIKLTRDRGFLPPAKGKKGTGNAQDR